MKNDEFPRTLQQAIIYFSDPDICLDFVAFLRWPNGIAVCPRCNSDKTYFLSTRRIWKCKGCKKQFSAKVGTIFEDSPIGLDKWLCAIWLISNAKNGISSYEVSRALGITQKTAWFMMHRIRAAMETGTFEKLSGTVEVDETYIGGLAKNMHWKKRPKNFQGRSVVTKAIVFGLKQRNGEVRATTVPDVSRDILQDEINVNVEPGSNLFTDQWKSYNGLDDSYMHEVVHHSNKEYVRGNVHTNGIENFWSNLKRTLKGTYISVESHHLNRYLAEQTFRYNQRKVKDGDRFLTAVKNIIGKRLTYKQLTQS